MPMETPETTSKVEGQDVSGQAPPSPTLSMRSPLQLRTNTADIDSTITHPGSVKINVKGAFIMDQDSGSPNGSYVTANGGSHDTKDIRLPNHTAVVSHIAVDVCSYGPYPLHECKREPYLIAMADWRVPRKVGILLPGAAFARTRRTIAFYEFRDGSDR